MDYMTLANVIEDLETLHCVADIEKLMIKYERKMERIEQQIVDEYESELMFEMDDGA
tara:strand:- start:500 stop:670 length:171 start_codon:yes stop_codon:yes gene_type:complete